MGLDYQHIPNIELLPWEYFCPLCHLLIIPNETLQSMCGHLYCKPCLAYVASTTMACPYDGYLVTQRDAKPLMESNKRLADTIGNTAVNCLYLTSGCTWLGSHSDSSLHCSGCPFGNSLVICSWCGIRIAHRKWLEHAQSCLMHAYVGPSVAMATSQANAQGHGVAAAVLAQKQWYQQLYQQYYQNGVGYYMHQQPLHLPNLAPQNGVGYYVQPEVRYMAQRHSQMQAHYLQNAQVPQYQQFHGHGQIRSQLEIQNPMHPHASTIQNTPSQNTIGQSQSNQPHAYWNGQKMYHQAPVPESSNIYSSQQPLPKPSLPQQHTTAPKTVGVYNQKHQTLQVQQPITPILGFQPQVNHHSASASIVGSEQAAPILPSVKEADIQRTQNQVHQASWGDKVTLNHIVGGDAAILDGSEARSSSDSTNTAYGMNLAVEIATNNELKGKRFDDCAESLHGSNILVEDNEIKSGPFGKQVMKENVGNGQKTLRKGFLVERKGTEDSLSLIRQHYLPSEDVETGAYSSGSLDRGFDKRSLVSPHEKHEPDLKLRPASRFPRPSIDLGERQFRRGQRSPVSEHLGMPSHGYGPLYHGLGGGRAETTDTEGRFRFGWLRREFKGHGNLQMGEKVQDADMTGPVDSNGRWPGDIGYRNRYTSQGSYPGEKESFPNSRKRVTTTDPVEGLDFHSYAKEHQPKSMGVKKLKLSPAVTSPPFRNQNKDEEKRFGGLG